MQNKKSKSKFTDNAYNHMLEKLTREVYLVKSKAEDVVSDIDKDKWIETSRSKINLKQAINLLLDYKDDYNYQSKNRIYRYDGTVEFGKNKFGSVRKLIELEARTINEIYYDAKVMFEHLKDYKLSSVKYKRLYEMMVELNQHNILLLKYKKDLQIENEKWDRLVDCGYDDGDCELDTYSEHEQIEMQTQHSIKIESIEKYITDIESIIKNLNKQIKKLSLKGIDEKDIANTFYY